ncbi:MAG: chemotaxis protein CheY [Patescibacteria group bacterium]|jgi:DNA-binding response OmpR family regulator|nr:chemotaxis protein CheY [Patescibacteria group bacterium]
MKENKARILLVEDDLALATAYKVRMEAEGFDIHHCPNGEEAMQEALRYHPDLILLDIMMPKISGFDVLDILRNTKETAHTKIIILTALSQPSDRQRAKDLGADEFLVKSQAVIADVMKRIRFHLGIKEPEAA